MVDVKKKKTLTFNHITSIFFSLKMTVISYKTVSTRGNKTPSRGSINGMIIILSIYRA